MESPLRVRLLLPVLNTFHRSNELPPSMLSFAVSKSGQTEIIVIKNDGTVTYSITKDGKASSQKTIKIDNSQRIKLVAMIKETGFLSLPFESFSIKEGIETYQKFGLKITLNDDTNQLYWPEPNATEKMIPPIITMVQEELELIMEIIRE